MLFHAGFQQHGVEVFVGCRSLQRDYTNFPINLFSHRLLCGSGCFGVVLPNQPKTLPICTIIMCNVQGKVQVIVMGLCLEMQRCTE